MKEDFHVKDSNLPDLLFPKAFPQCCSREEQLCKFLEYCKENIYQGEHFCSLLLCKSCPLSGCFHRSLTKILLRTFMDGSCEKKVTELKKMFKSKCKNAETKLFVWRKLMLVGLLKPPCKTRFCYTFMLFYFSYTTW